METILNGPNYETQMLVRTIRTVGGLSILARKYFLTGVIG